MDTEAYVQVTVLSDRNATVAEVVYADPHATVFDTLPAATGSSKREPGDLYDERIAYDLAIGRALEKLGHDLRKRAEKAVRAACPVDHTQDAEPEEDVFTKSGMSLLRQVFGRSNSA